MDAAQIITLIVGTGGLGAFLASLSREVKLWRSGAHMREKERNATALGQRDIAYEIRDQALAERDHEASYRRIIQEYASGLRRRLIEAGVHPPPWPSRDPLPRVEDD